MIIAQTKVSSSTIATQTLIKKTVVSFEISSCGCRSYSQLTSTESQNYLYRNTLCLVVAIKSPLRISTTSIENRKNLTA